MQLTISAYKMTWGQSFQSDDMGLHFQTTLGTFQFCCPEGFVIWFYESEV